MSTMRRILFLAWLIPNLAVTSAEALWETQAGVFVVDATTLLEYNNNLFASATEIGDWSVSLTPALRYQQDRGTLHMIAEVGGAFGRFMDYDDENYDDFRSRLELSYPHRENTRLNWSLSAGLNQQSAGNPDLTDRTRVTLANASAVVRYEYSEKFGVTVNSDYLDNHFRTSGYEDFVTWGVVADLLYLYSEKLDLLVGYRYRDTHYDKSQQPRAHDHAFSFGASGELGAKVSGEARVGWQWRDAKDFYSDTESGLYYSLGLTWAAREKTTVSLTGQRDYSVSGASQSIQRTNLKVGLVHRFVEKFGVDLYIGWGDEAYSGNPAREDEVWMAGAGARYDINQYLGIFVLADAQSRDSSAPLSNYDQYQLMSGFQFIY